MPATPISSHLPGLAPSMNPREPAHHARDAHLGPHPRARPPKPPASPRRWPPTHTNQQIPGLAPPKKTPASPQKRPPTHTNQQVPGLALPQNPCEPAKTASHPHQPTGPRARTTPKPPRAREDGFSPTPTSKSTGSHHLQTPASPRRRPLTHTNQQVTGLAPHQSPPRARKDGL